jgi:hypothetical protein
MGSMWGAMRCVNSPVSALDIMDLHRAVDSTPQIGIGDRHHVAEEFPAPAVLSPLGQAEPDPLSDVATRGDQRYA